MTETATTLVRKEIVVEAPVERAFTVFTEGIGDFKPPEHNLLAVPIAVTVFEPRVGGHIIDRGEDGSECRWGSVLVYDPQKKSSISLRDRHVSLARHPVKGDPATTSARPRRR
jgi:hypothetical protein